MREKLEDVLHRLIHKLMEYDITPDSIKIVGRDRRTNSMLHDMVKAEMKNHLFVHTGMRQEAAFCGLQIGECFYTQPKDALTKEEL